MKLFISFLFTFLSVGAFSQTFEKEVFTEIKNEKSKHIDNRFSTKKDNKIFSNLSIDAFLILENNSEGKFYKITKSDSKIENLSTKKIKSESLETEIKKDFIQEIILKELTTNYKAIEIYTSLIRDEDDLEDAKKDLYRSHSQQKNRLQKIIDVNNTVEVRIGKLVYTFQQKQYLSELDKTLFNSLNLIAINY